MEDIAFKQSMIKTQQREALVGSALARYFDCSIRFNESEDLRKYDYILYSSEKGYCFRCEQQDDKVCKSTNGTLYFEQCTFNKDGTTKDGKLIYTKAQKFVYILNNLNQILILDVKLIRNLVSVYQNAGVLETTMPGDFEAWIKKHDTLPTQGVLLPYEDILLNDPKAKIFTYDQLSISTNQYLSLH